MIHREAEECRIGFNFRQVLLGLTKEGDERQRREEATSGEAGRPKGRQSLIHMRMRGFEGNPVDVDVGPCVGYEDGDERDKGSGGDAHNESDQESHDGWVL